MNQEEYKQNEQDDILQRDLNHLDQEYVKLENVDQEITASENLVRAHSILNRSGLALFIMSTAVLLVQLIIGEIIANFAPQITEFGWYTWVLVGFSMVGIGLPVFYLAIKNVPPAQPGEVKNLSVFQFFGTFFICTAAMYITNFFGIFINLFITLAQGKDILNITNPLADTISSSSIIATILYAGIIGPIVEELIFRKLLLSRLRRFGDLPAILLSGFAFGLFHMNLSQFFYATALGIIFAYVTLKTNTIRYSILLHIMINLIGSAVAPLVLKQGNLIMISMIALWVILSIVLGIIIFIFQVKKIHFDRAAVPLSRKSVYILNPGTILFGLVCLGMIVRVILL